MLKKSIKQYKGIIGSKKIRTLYEKSSRLNGKRIFHLNSTYYGGGVAEILINMVLLMDSLGLETEWSLLRGSSAFFAITKEFHNAMQGSKINLTKTKKKIYLLINEINSKFKHMDKDDFVVIHDPQPLSIINFYKKRTGRWVWRCHIDITSPDTTLWKFARNYINKYDAMIVSMDKYLKKDVKPKQFIIPPSIDPLSIKNREISKQRIKKKLSEYNINLDKPIICQISRFDKFKDPLGVVKCFFDARKKFDCQLVLAGSMASDDPEGIQVYNHVLKKVKGNKDITLITKEDNILVNALQRASHVILQKSLKEGFGLTVSEALWKETPVIAGNVGGIPLQIKDGYNGYLVNNLSECTKRMIELIGDKKKAKEMGKRGKKIVKENFLITRHIENYLDLFCYLNKRDR